MATRSPFHCGRRDPPPRPCLLGFFLCGFGKDDAASGHFFLFDGLDEHAAAKGFE
jgi:hypothetical protein